jgi:hypothetical protein
MITRADFNSLTDYLNEIYNEAAQEAIDVMGSKELFDISDTQFRTYDYQLIHGLSGIRKVSEGSDLPEIAGLEGDSATWTQVHYGGLVSITDEMRRFDRYDQMEEIVRSVSEDAFHKVDQSLADVLIHGFSASNYVDVYSETVSATCPDGVALFSASHTNNATSANMRNLIRYPVGTNNPPLSREAVVQARVDAINHLDVNGLNRPINLDLLIVPPANYDLALRIVGSDKVSGSFENDINPLMGNVRVMQWSKLTTAADTTDGSAFWYMADSRRVKRSLKALFAKRPALDAPEEVYENKKWEYSLHFYYAIGRAWPAFIWGSNGTSA